LGWVDIGRTDIPTFAAGVVLVVCIVLVLARALRGPTVHDRLLGMNRLGTLAAVLVALLGFLAGRPGVFLDVALVFAALNFVATLAVLKYVRTRRLG
jgi:multicomponent Na+:H+ antiporter subunit F